MYGYTEIHQNTMHLGLIALEYSCSCLCALGIEVDMAFIQNVLLSRSAATANDMPVISGGCRQNKRELTYIPSIGFQRLVLQSQKPPTEVILYIPTLQFFQYSFNQKA